MNARMVLWVVGILIMVFLAFVPVSFAIQLRVDRLTFGLEGKPGREVQLVWVFAVAPRMLQIQGVA